ncbi:MAG TPA: gliding motility-associated C-terminal domain-containing protein [Bacteroidia bacterium]|jgi:gliding motility-associated-like protein
MNKATSSTALLSAAIGLLALTVTGSRLHAQNILFNNGALVYIAPSTVVQVNGGFQNDGASGTTPVFENNGIMTIANSGTPGTVLLTNGSTLQGNGTFNVEQDWINNASFNAGSSTVVLNGNLQQFVTSANGTITTFNNLTLTGTGTGADRKKTLQLINSNIGPNGVLNLTDRELETLANTMFVLNPSVASVTGVTVFGGEGFVSSNVGGALSRVTNSNAVYVFPTGSSSGIPRFRAVEVTPASSASNTFTVRLGNNNATLDGFNVLQLDSSMCKVTRQFYHQINRTSGTDNADIDVFYDQITDGPWDGLAQWNTPTSGRWNNMGTITASISPTYNDNKKASWSDFSNDPYILSREKLAEPTFACNDVCANSSGNIFNATGAPAGTTYVWSTPAGTTIASGQGTGTISVDWGTISGPVTVMDTNALGCFSDPVSCSVTVSIPPTADFSSSNSGFNYSFTDLSTGGATQWAWDFGDGNSSAVQNPAHGYTSNGTQMTVCLTASNSTGCADSTCRILDVNVLEFINIPNVFTPDNDGINDVFYINNSGISEYQLEIYNRWGTKVFTSEEVGTKWDGRSSAGVELSEGTYFFILKAVSVTAKDYSTTGFVTLLRNK